LAKASLEGFNLTYKELNEQQEIETNKRFQLEAEIALEDAALEKEKVGFIEKERALQSMQHEFNDMLQNLRTKENDKNLATQKLHYLKEKETNLNEFLNRAEGQVKTIGDSIEYTQLQVTDEENKLIELSDRVTATKMDVEAKRSLYDEKRAAVDVLRTQFQQIQRNQFDAEKSSHFRYVYSKFAKSCNPINR
jgi:chromosome segregation protein